MNDLQIFTHEQFGKIRAIDKNGEPWFVANDVCQALEIDRTQTRRLDDDEKGVCSIHTPGGEQEVSIVNEPGLYSLVLGSRKPEAKAFKRWITHEVIPSIRKHGAYLTPAKIEEALLNPDTIIQLATALKEEQAKTRALTARVEEDKPKVLFADAVAASEGTILIGELAKILKGNGVDIGQNRLFEWLRREGYLVKRKGTDYNMPTQRSMELGLFKIKETSITHPDGHVTVSKTPKITGKGQRYFVNLFLGKEQEQAI